MSKFTFRYNVNDVGTFCFPLRFSRRSKGKPSLLADVLEDKRVADWPAAAVVGDLLLVFEDFLSSLLAVSWFSSSEESWLSYVLRPNSSDDFTEPFTSTPSSFKDVASLSLTPFTK